MKNFRYIWVFGLAVTALIIILPIALVVTEPQVSPDDPWAYVPVRSETVDHSALVPGPYANGEEVTAACLECHTEEAHEVMSTAHWTWEGEPVMLEGRDEPVTIGKANSINNFCIGVQSNWPSCTSCHVGYGWEDDSFDFTDANKVDCLVCHDQSGGYVKGKAGVVAEGVDLVAVAGSVGRPTRENCGSCHFNGGGGNAVKHGDLDQSLLFPSEYVDVHMGRYDFVCVDCHQAQDHNIKGRSIGVSVDNTNQVFCTDCHTEDLHEDQRINAHVDTVACQTCHIPQGAVRDATKMHWDWSAAGDFDREQSSHEYLAIKGSFVYEADFTPEYLWYNGMADRYIFGDLIDEDGTTELNPPQGTLTDPNSKIWPFKVHYANQVYDTEFNYLLQPKTAGEGGYWTEFDWDLAVRLGSQASGMVYSGNYGFTETNMHWTLSHMVTPKEQALQCTDCHGEGDRMDWAALGYNGDPMIWGGRNVQRADDDGSTSVGSASTEAAPGD